MEKEKQNKQYNFGVVTFFDANNYGAVLQTYALQRFLKNNNINSCVINTNWKEKEKIRSIRGLLYYVKNCKNIKKKQAYFSEFINKNIPLSPFYEINNLSRANSICDYFIVGSDQVWNHQWNFNRNAFYLTFTDQKYSYAASFGSINESLKKRESMIKSDLSKFNFVSVRENSAKEYLSKLGINSEVHVDPTFLLTLEQWAALEKQPKKVKKGYVLLYLLEKNQQIVKDAKTYAKSKGLSIYSIIDTSKKRIDGVNVVSYLRPEEFIYLFHYASAVFTNSFHGLAFSLIFKKIFFTYLQNRTDAPNDRVLSLLENTRLDYRIVKDTIPFYFPDFSYSQIFFEKERKKSLSYFKNILSGQYRQQNNLTEVFPKYYYVRSKKQEVLAKARSGGVATTIGLHYIKNGWAAYGAVLENNKAIIKQLYTEDDVYKASNSKYVESDFLNSIERVKKELESGNKVFYCALPCQIKSLLRYLETNNVNISNLVTADVVCHGTPKKEYFLDYINYLEKKYHGKVEDFNFRDKSFGWSGHVETYSINGKKYKSRLYTQLFYSNYLLRDCCYKCPFANLNRVADITLMDSWGYTKSEHVKEGASITIINSKNGEKLIIDIMDDFEINQIDRLPFIQPNLLFSSIKPEKYSVFKSFYGSREFVKNANYALRDIKRQERKNFIKRKIVTILHFFSH